MLIFWDQRLVFLATPKAASTAIETALESLASTAVLRPAALRHTTAAAFRDHVGPWLAAMAGEPFTAVAMMREPVDWLRSWYRFRRRDDQTDPGHPMRSISFERFATDYMASPRAGLAGVGTQFDHLTDAGGRPAVDRIFRYDALDRFVHFLEDRLGCEILLPRVNVPPEADVGLARATEADLRRHLARDIALYESLG